MTLDLEALVFILGYTAEVITAGWWIWVIYFIHRTSARKNSKKPPNFKTYLIIAASWGLFIETVKILTRY